MSIPAQMDVDTSKVLLGFLFIDKTCPNFQKHIKALLQNFLCLSLLVSLLLLEFVHTRFVVQMFYGLVLPDILCLLLSWPGPVRGETVY